MPEGNERPLCSICRENPAEWYEPYTGAYYCSECVKAFNIPRENLEPLETKKSEKETTTGRKRRRKVREKVKPEPVEVTVEPVEEEYEPVMTEEERAETREWFQYIREHRYDPHRAVFYIWKYKKDGKEYATPVIRLSAMLLPRLAQLKIPERTIGRVRIRRVRKNVMITITLQL